MVCSGLLPIFCVCFCLVSLCHVANPVSALPLPLPHSLLWVSPAVFVPNPRIPGQGWDVIKDFERVGRTCLFGLCSLLPKPPALPSFCLLLAAWTGMTHPLQGCTSAHSLRPHPLLLISHHVHGAEVFRTVPWHRHEWWVPLFAVFHTHIHTRVHGPPTCFRHALHACGVLSVVHARRAPPLRIALCR